MPEHCNSATNTSGAKLARKTKSPFLILMRALNEEIMNIFRTLRAVKFLVTGPVILAVLVLINAMTSPGDWWVKWAALGIGIAWIFSLLRVIRAMLLVGGLLALIAYLKNHDQAINRPEGT